MILSIIIPTCNRLALLKECLKRLSPGTQTLHPDFYEIIVTDDGKDSETKTFLHTEFPTVQYLQGPRKGPAANRNNGAKYASGNWLVFIDDDCLPQENCLEIYYNSIKSYPEIKVFEGAIHPTDWSELGKDMAECPVNTSGGNFWSANICVEKELFFNVQGFDETYLIAAQEDQDLHLKLLAKGKILFLPDSVVKHPIRILSLWKKIKTIPIAGKNWLYYCLKNQIQLGYTSKWSIIKAGYHSQLKAFVNSFSNNHYKNLFLSFMWLTFGMAVIIKNILFLSHYNDIKKK